MRASNANSTAKDPAALPIVLERPKDIAGAEDADTEFLFKFVGCGLFNTSSVVAHQSYMMPARCVLRGVNTSSAVSILLTSDRDLSHQTK